MGQQRRTAVIEMARAGYVSKDVSKVLGYPCNTVYRIYNAFMGEVKDVRKTHTLCSDCKRTPRFVAGLKRSISANPALPMTVLAKKKGVSTRIIGRAIKEDLNLHSYKLVTKHLLTDKQKEVRLIRAKKILNNLKSHGNCIVFFSDKKMWTVDRTKNSRNDRFLTSSRSNIPAVYRTKNPASSMKLGVMASTGEVMPIHFFAKGEKVNTAVCMKVLEQKIIR